MFSVSVPAFFSVMVWIVPGTPTPTLPNARLVGVRAACGIPALIPVTDKVCVAPVILPALSVTVMVAVCVLPAFGAKETDTRQLVPAVSVTELQALVVSGLLRRIRRNHRLDHQAGSAGVGNAESLRSALGAQGPACQS